MRVCHEYVWSVRENVLLAMFVYQSDILATETALWIRLRALYVPPPPSDFFLWKVDTFLVIGAFYDLVIIYSIQTVWSSFVWQLRRFRDFSPIKIPPFTSLYFTSVSVFMNTKWGECLKPELFSIKDEDFLSLIKFSGLARFSILKTNIFSWHKIVLSQSSQPSIKNHLAFIKSPPRTW